mgnify:CR=1 FL=1
MSTKELRNLQVVEQVRSGQLTSLEAAARLDVTDRTVRRWKALVAEQGAQGLTHASRGQVSPRRISPSERQHILKLIQAQYLDFGPTLVAEKLVELHGITRDPTTVRDLMVSEGLWIPRSKRTGWRSVVHRKWRERRAHRGELVQFDGSYHSWFEGRGGLAETCLLAAIDDATGQLLRLRFAPHEGTLPVMGFWTEYARKQGLPKEIYLDRFSTYKMTQQVAQENPDLKTQLQRAMDTLGVKLIFALSPQAKGRVERLFKTLQDRLVKELRLRNISSVTAANQFLDQHFVQDFNKKFSCTPREPTDFHRLLSIREQQALPETLCRMEQRVTQHDFTLSFKAQWYQLLPTRGLAIRPKDIVLVREYPEHTLSFSIRGKQALVKPIAKSQERRSSARQLAQTLVPT